MVCVAADIEGGARHGSDRPMFGTGSVPRLYPQSDTKTNFVPKMVAAIAVSQKINQREIAEESSVEVLDPTTDQLALNIVSGHTSRMSCSTNRFSPAHTFCHTQTYARARADLRPVA